MYQSVVRIFATTLRPDYAVPWQSAAPQSGTGSGVVIAPGRVLTGAHVINDATFLQVQKVSDPNKMLAKVVAVSHDCDLALLEIDDPRFMEGVTPEELGALPALRDRVSVVGYPVGGEEISITEGVVSRIEMQRYAHSERSMLAVTVDAAINEGNSGGPVFMDGKVAGIAFQSLQDAENIGEMVPATLIKRFLRGVDEGRSLHIPGMGICAQGLENPSIRRRCGLRGAQSGMLIIGIENGGCADGVLEVGDALMRIGEHVIANNGSVQYQGSYRTGFDVVLGDHYIGDVLPLQVMRRGEVVDLEVTLGPFCSLVPRSQYDVSPTYFMYAGIVFQPLSLDYLRTWRDWWEKAPAEFLYQYYSGARTEERHEVVVLNQVLADEVNVGYERIYNVAVRSVNGVVPRDMGHFVSLVEQATGRLEILTSDRCLVVFEVDEARAANARIMDRYHIDYDRSVGLRTAAE